MNNYNEPVSDDGKPIDKFSFLLGAYLVAKDPLGDKEATIAAATNWVSVIWMSVKSQKQMMKQLEQKFTSPEFLALVKDMNNLFAS